MASLSLTLVISSLTRGGAERVMSFLASSWANQGKDVTLLTLDHGEEPAYPLHPLVKRRSLGLQSMSKGFLGGIVQNLRRVRVLRHAIRASHPDIVISFIDQVNVLTLLATCGFEVPVIVCEHCDPSGPEVGQIWNILRRHVYPRAQRLVCLTNATLVRFRAMMRINGCVIPNPVTGPFLPVQGNGDANNSAPRVLIAMGRLVPQKGFDLLLNAFARVVERHPGWSLTILGKGPLRDELQKQVLSLNLTGHVHLAGEISDPFPVLQAADLFVLSSRFEGFPLALCEAMACGLPAISFDCPSGPGDIIRNGVDGVLVPAHDIAALAVALDRLMGDTPERQRLASRAREVVERFAPQKILLLWEQLFQELRPS